MSHRQISLIVSIVGCLAVWSVTYGLLFTQPNFAEHLVGGGAGIAAGVVLRPVVESWLASRRP